MGETTGIAWTDSTVQVTSGCKEWSPGCTNCYATRQAHRMGENPNAKIRARYHGLTVVKGGAPRWNGVVHELPDQLRVPLGWRAPRRVFVNSLSDLFQEGVSNEFIAAVFGMMAACPQHTFQILTKRPDRMAEWFKWCDRRAEHGLSLFPEDPASWRIRQMCRVEASRRGLSPARLPNPQPVWPLPNVWLGTSVEDQAHAEERVPHLLRVPAAVRFLSMEPLLEAVDLDPPTCPTCDTHEGDVGSDGVTLFCREHDEELAYGSWLDACASPVRPGINWVIVGGESGPSARPFDLAWARSILAQCAEAGIPAFMKQTGDNAVTPNAAGLTVPFPCIAHHGSDPSEWPDDLRVQQFPEVSDAR